MKSKMSHANIFSRLLKGSLPDIGRLHVQAATGHYAARLTHQVVLLVLG